MLMQEDDTNSSSTKDVRRKLLSKGFIAPHVEESLTYKTTYQGALDWLCIFVPEEDLPKLFKPTDSDRIEGHKHDEVSLAKEYSIRRVVDAGFSRKVAAQALEQYDEAMAITSLCWRLAEYENNSEPYLEEFDEIITEEKQVLESIFSDSFRSIETDSSVTFEFQLPIFASGHSKLTVIIPKVANYPNSPPGLVITEHGIPAYIRLAIMQQAMTECTSYLGAPMIYSIVSWIQENGRLILSNPPQLTSLKILHTSAMIYSEQELPQQKSKKNPKRNRSKFSKSSLVLFTENQAKMGTPAYQKMLAARKKLPSYSRKQEICAVLNANQCLLICGETGCGKSTQVGQFILEEAVESQHGLECMIICTQPRRISAIALAERVAAERAEKVGEMVGYSIKGVSIQSADTKLLFCTTGVLLRMVQGDPTLSHVSHIIIDEVHERGVESDFLLILLRDLLKTRKDLKIVLMSATIDASLISSYFSNCPVIDIEGFTYPVENKYLEDVLEVTDYSPEQKRMAKDSEGFQDDDDGISESMARKLNFIENSVNYSIDYGLIGSLAAYICQEMGSGAILIFLSGNACSSRCHGNQEML